MFYRIFCGKVRFKTLLWYFCCDRRWGRRDSAGDPWAGVSTRILLKAAIQVVNGCCPGTPVSSLLTVSIPPWGLCQFSLAPDCGLCFLWLLLGDMLLTLWILCWAGEGTMERQWEIRFDYSRLPLMVHEQLTTQPSSCYLALRCC